MLLEEVSKVGLASISPYFRKKFLVLLHEFFDFLKVAHYLVAELTIYSFLTKASPVKILARKVLQSMWEVAFLSSMAVPSQEVLAEILLEVEVRLMLIHARSLSRKTLELWTIHLDSLSLFLSIKLILNGLGFLEVSLVLLFVIKVSKDISIIDC